MRQDKVQYIKYCLLRKMAELRNVAGSTLHRLKNGEQNFYNLCDEVAVECSKAVELAVRGKERNLMLDIQETIMRIDRGLFGVCDHCSQKIPDERLIKAPMSKLCLKCQDKYEHQKKYRKKSLPVKSILLNNVY